MLDTMTIHKVQRLLLTLLDRQKLAGYVPEDANLLMKFCNYTNKMQAKVRKLDALNPGLDLQWYGPATNCTSFDAVLALIICMATNVEGLWLNRGGYATPTLCRRQVAHDYPQIIDTPICLSPQLAEDESEVVPY
jgi:hypothetical protein